ncbi:acylneuraminate cytidylyltransferase family protein [Thioclava kandeliae]|uniref:Acylneuraminate cytidylyltransferase family protein n=1 Tax=Thioclava kandeliae TaxID=3070818 RepID=A0ABV1SM58_9RHOB
MTASPVHVFLPCRGGSQRVPHKNTRTFAGIPGGLLELKLRQLSEAAEVASVTVNTDDPEVMRVAESMRGLFKVPLHVSERPAALAAAGTLDDFVAYVPTIMPEGIIYWTHVTSPFFEAKEIDNSIKMYRSEVENGDYDSLMGVSRIQTFLWDNKGECISHNRAAVKWPQTQDLDPIFEINSSVFMISKAEMANRCDRIGDKPFLFSVEKLEAFDVDWPEDFKIAELIYKSR